MAVLSLDDAPRVATVRALTPVETYALSRDDFRALVGRPPTGDIIRRAARRRAGAAPPPGTPTPSPTSSTRAA